MKFWRAIGNALITIIIVGLINYSGISDNRPDVSHTYQQNELLFYFISAQGVCFVVITNVLMNGIFSVSLVFPKERQVFAKEVASKTYGPFPYFISKLIF